MGLLSKIQSGRQRKPVTVCVYGVPGVGKTSFASAAPKPIVFDLEGGSSFLNVSRVEEHTFKTLVVDTLDALEALAIAYVCQNNGKKTLADFSYGAGYAHLQQEWRLFLRALEVLREKRDMNIVLIAHEHRKSFSDPELGAFEVYRPKLQDKVWALTNEWCDAVLFAQFDQALLEKKDQKDRVIISGRRVLRTQRGTGYVAKNRFGLPEVIDLDWKTFETAAQPIPVETLKATLTSLLAQASDDIQAKAKTYLAERGETPETLRAVTERVQTLIAQAA
jgi:hypothetical protein